LNDCATKAAQEIRHNLHICNLWNIGNGGLTYSQKRGCHQFQDRVLGSSYMDLTDKARPALNAEAIID
jgi:hypothetical protein